MQKNLVLVGPMGSGKTTIGKQLARSLGLEFVDTDRAIEDRTGVDIPLIFELEGESGFRRRECEMIARLMDQQNTVLATGGGAVLDPENRKHLIGFGQVIYLSCSVDQQLSRTSRNRNRPLLQTENPRLRLETLFQQRDPIYKQIADIEVPTDGKNVRQVVREIMDHLAPEGSASEPLE